MVRPKCPRRLAALPGSVALKPQGIPLDQLKQSVLTLDEYEAIRLADFEGLYHEQSAAQMKISRATFGRILESAHGKIADALINRKALCVKGGVVKMTRKRLFRCSKCEHTWELACGTCRPDGCPECGSEDFFRVDGCHRQGSGGHHGGRCHHRHGTQTETGTKSGA